MFSFIQARTEHLPVAYLVYVLSMTYSIILPNDPKRVHFSPSVVNYIVKQATYDSLTSVFFFVNFNWRRWWLKFLAPSSFANLKSAPNENRLHEQLYLSVCDGVFMISLAFTTIIRFAFASSVCGLCSVWCRFSLNYIRGNFAPDLFVFEVILHVDVRTRQVQTHIKSRMRRRRRCKRYITFNRPIDGS